MTDEAASPEYIYREFKPSLYQSLLEASNSSNPMMQAMASTPEFKAMLDEQIELLAILNLRRKLSVSDEMADDKVNEVITAATVFAKLIRANVQVSKATGSRTMKIETSEGTLQVTYTPPFGSSR